MKNLIPIATAAIIATAALPAFAVEDQRTPVNVPPAEWMSVTDVTKKLAEAGYDVREIERDDGVYEIEATKKDGTRVEAHVHPGTGEVLAERADDDWF